MDSNFQSISEKLEKVQKVKLHEIKKYTVALKE